MTDRWRSEYILFLLELLFVNRCVSPTVNHHSLIPYVPSSNSPQFLGCCEHVSGVGEQAQGLQAQAAPPPLIPTQRSHHLLLLERLGWLCHRVKYSHAVPAGLCG